MTRSIALWSLAFSLVGCGPRETGREQRLEFEGFTVEEGVYKPKPGWKFTKRDNGKIAVARANTGPGVIITPCECALETGGTCSQAESRDPNGDIREIWCVDDGCGFCVGGTAEPDDESAIVRFNVVCIEGRRAS